MNNKYTAVALAHKNLEEDIKKKISLYGVSYLASEGDLNKKLLQCEPINTFKLNDRICMYLEDFKDKTFHKLREGYEITIVEFHHSYLGDRVDILKKLDIEYQEDLLVLGIIKY